MPCPGFNPTALAATNHAAGIVPQLANSMEGWLNLVN